MFVIFHASQLKSIFTVSWIDVWTPPPPPKKKKLYQKRCGLTNFDMFYIFECIQELHFLYVVQGNRKHHHENRV